MCEIGTGKERKKERRKEKKRKREIKEKSIKIRGKGEDLRRQKRYRVESER